LNFKSSHHARDINWAFPCLQFGIRENDRK